MLTQVFDAWESQTAVLLLGLLGRWFEHLEGWIF